MCIRDSLHRYTESQKQHLVAGAAVLDPDCNTNRRSDRWKLGRNRHAGKHMGHPSQSHESKAGTPRAFVYTGAIPVGQAAYKKRLAIPIHPPWQAYQQYGHAEVHEGSGIRHKRKSRALCSAWIPQHIPGLVRRTDRFSKRTGGVRFGSCASKQGGGRLPAK